VGILDFKPKPQSIRLGTSVHERNAAKHRNPSNEGLHMTIHNSLAELIGNTPLVKLNHIPQVAGVKSTIAVKVEYFNPGGTISGTGKYLKEASNGAVKVIGSDPEGSIYSASSRDEVHQYDIEGVGEDFYPKAFNRNITDDIVRVSDVEAFEMTRRLAGEEALLVGGSSGMAVASAIKYALANDLDENQIVVVLAPDSGRSYLEKIFNDDWMRANGYGDIVERTSKPSLAEQYLDGAPSDEGAGDGLHN
jgi:cystathionine beta-synthase